jgi:iron complex transport system ATP-binding protein
MMRIENISFSYNAGPVISNLSAEIRAGEFVGIIGPNGSGKSTLLKLMSKILVPSSGAMSMGGRDLKEISLERYARQVAYMPSDTEVCFSFNVREFITMGRFPHAGRYAGLGKKDLHIINMAARNLGIEHLSEKRMEELSQGEKQMVFLAQAIIQQPRLLLLDEPTSHLDIGHTYRIMDSILKLNSEDLTVVAVLHDLNLASEYCKRLILLKDGKILRHGSPQEVITYQNIENSYMTRVLVYKNPFSGKPHVFGIPSSLRK